MQKENKMSHKAVAHINPHLENTPKSYLSKKQVKHEKISQIK